MKNRQSGAVNWRLIGGTALAILVLVGGVLIAQGNGGPTLLAYLPFLLILACPLMMLFMMRSMGSMDHHPAGPHEVGDGTGDDRLDMATLTRNQQVWALRNELTKLAWRQEALREDLERIEQMPVTDADKLPITRQ